MKTQINTSAASKAFSAGLQAAFCMSGFSVLQGGFKLFMVFFLSCAPFFAKAQDVSALTDEISDRTAEAQELIKAIDETIAEIHAYCSDNACPTVYNEAGYLYLAELDYAIVLMNDPYPEITEEEEIEKRENKAAVIADIKQKAGGRVIAVQKLISLRNKLQEALGMTEQAIAFLIESQELSAQAGMPGAHENQNRMSALLH